MTRPALLALVLLAPLLAAGALGPAVPAWAAEPLPAGLREFPLVMHGVSFNGRVWPDTPLLEAYVGDVVTFTVLVPAVSEPHTFHVHGHTWTDPASGATIDTKLLKPGEHTRFTLVAGGADAHAGDWLYHCHVDLHLVSGMSGVFRVYPFSLAAEDATRDATGDVVLRVRAARLGEPVEVASLVVARADGVALPSAWREVAPGAFEVRVPRAMAPEGAAGLLVTASADGLGESVARLAGGAPAPRLGPPATEAPAHGHAPVAVGALAS